ncbi:MAG: DUF1294 domain-containing protein [Planctomycetes bacterium]|nr:DUF1294 domain-containing protein [Planctomycetota bacterium]
MSPVVLTIVAAINVVTFLAFGWDKHCARCGRRRVPERWLIGLTFATGLFGAWLAMPAFRHKTQKTSFRLRIAFVTLFNPLWLIAWGLWW